MAIARDTSLAWVSTTGTTSNSQSYTNAGDLLIVWTYQEATDNETSVKFNNVSMTAIPGAVAHMCYDATGTTDHVVRAYYLIAPLVGTANIVATRTGTTNFYGISAISYTGTNQSAQPDGSTAFISGSAGACGVGATSLSGNISVTASNCWVAATARSDNGVATTGTGVLTRISAGAGSVNVNTLYDSNGTVATGSDSVGASGAGAGSAWFFSAVSFSPAAGAVATTRPNNLLTLGVS